MPSNKKKIIGYIDDETDIKINSLIESGKYKNRISFFEAAINNEIANQTLSDPVLMDRLSKILLNPIRAMLSDGFKMLGQRYYSDAIEQSLTNLILASALDNIDDEILEELRKIAKENVLSNNGIINLKEARKRRHE